MRIIKTTDPFPIDTLGQLAYYNGMDVCSLFEINAGLDELLTPSQLSTYEFEMELLAALLSMEFSGVYIDISKRAEMVALHKAELAKVQSHLHTLCEAIGYYDYYINQAVLRFSTESGVDANLLPRSWDEWLQQPISWRRQVKQLAPVALAEYQKSLKLYGQPFNGNSPAQKLRLFYCFFGHTGNTTWESLTPDFPPPWPKVYGITEHKTRNVHNEYTPAVDRESLDKIESRAKDFNPRDAHVWAWPFVKCCMDIADLTKTLSFLQSKLEKGKLKTTFGAVTETGRLNSKENAQGFGGNMQNITPRLRNILTCKWGDKITAIDYGQIESRCVAARCFIQFGAINYMNATECLTEDHEVLTRNGWVPITDKPSEIMCWSLQRTMEFQPVALWTDRMADSTIELATKAYSMRATKGHKTIYYGGRYLDDLRVETMAESYARSSYRTPVSGKYYGGSYNSPIQARLLAAFQADGTINNRGKIEFSFSKERKVERLTTLLNEAGVSFYTNVFPPYGNQSKPTTRFYISQRDWPGFLEKKAGSYLFAMNQETLNTYVKEHEYWDGSRENKKGYRITAKDRSHLEWLAIAAHLTGRIASDPIPDHESWRMSIQDRDRTDAGCGLSQITNTEVRVLCPTTPTGFFLYRRHGHIAVSGNCGDLHSLAASMVWEDLPWPDDFTLDWLAKHGPFPADMLKAAKKLASVKFYRGKSRRDVSKTLGHGTSYMGRPAQMSRMSHIDIKLIEHYQAVFFQAFPEIRMWHRWVAEQIQTKGELTTVMGRTRRFFGRPNDDATLREAVAFDPQSTAADYTNTALLRIHKEIMKGNLPGVLLFQKHDELGISFKESLQPTIVPQIVSLMEHRIPITSPTGEVRQWYVPAEAEVGWNLGHRVTTEGGRIINPDGLTAFPDNRERQRNPFSLMDTFL